MNEDIGVAKRLVAAIGLIASCVSIFAFLTGWQSVQQMLKVFSADAITTSTAQSSEAIAQMVDHTPLPIVSTSQITATPMLEEPLMASSTPVPTSGSSAATTNMNPRSGRIAFRSYGSGNEGIFVIHADGSGLSRVTSEAHVPIWSADGQSIAFSEMSGRQPNVAWVYVDGSKLTHLVNPDPNLPCLPFSWSPDGQHIAAKCAQDSRFLIWNIFRFNVDGSGYIRLTSHSGEDKCPVWSSDGRFIAYVSDHDRKQEIHVMSADGKAQTQLTSFSRTSVVLGNLVWSPDGQYVAFDCNCGKGFEVWLVAVDGTSQHRLAQGSRPDWSPDGQRIVYANEGDIFVVGVNGNELDRLTDTANNFRPKWSPDGQSIAFESRRDGNSEIYVMSTDGSNQSRLTNSTTYEEYISWVPE